MVFANTIAHKIARIVFSDVGNKNGDFSNVDNESYPTKINSYDSYPTDEEKAQNYERLKEMGLTKTILKNICFRNLSEIVPAKEIKLAKLLKKPEARKPLLTYFTTLVNSEEVHDIPDLDIWEQTNSYGLDNLEFIRIYEDEDFIVMATSPRAPVNKYYMRIYDKKCMHM